MWKMNRISKRGQVAISILVLMAVALVSWSLFVFMTNSDRVESKIIDARVLNEIYYKENLINFYINEIVEEVVSEMIEKNEGEFVGKFREKIGRYFESEVGGELGLIEINEEDVVVGEDGVLVDLKIKIDKRVEGELIVNYLYSKGFEGEF